MHRTNELDPNGRLLVRTSNGVNTVTETVWNKEIVTFEPLPNGYNKALGDHIIAIIESQPSLWRQSTWRAARVAGEHEPLDSIRSMIYESLSEAGAMVIEPADNLSERTACGTAMCFAGWNGEVTGANYLIDATVLRAAVTSDGGWYGDCLERIVLSLEEAKHLSCDADPEPLADAFVYLPSYQVKLIKQRGFTPKTHVGEHVMYWSNMQLGLVHGDYLNLYGGDNSLETIKRVHELYAKLGPYPSQEDLAEAFMTRWGHTKSTAAYGAESWVNSHSTCARANGQTLDQGWPDRWARLTHQTATV